MNGETYVHGRDPDTARMLLDTCTRIGVPQHVVRTTETGFLVPDEVWDAAEQSLSAPEAEAAF